jgi:hypothetical protein
MTALNSMKTKPQLGSKNSDRHCDDILYCPSSPSNALDLLLLVGEPRQDKTLIIHNCNV